MGHSSGEIAAAFASKALTLENCMLLAYHRGAACATLIKSTSGVNGAMIAVGASEEEAASLLNYVDQGSTATIACINSPSNVTISGDETAISQIQKVAIEKGYFNRKLHVDVAYHSHHMKLIMDHYRSAIGKFKAAPSKITRFFSSLTGAEVNTLTLDDSYWVRNLVSPVKFSTALTKVCVHAASESTKSETADILVEIGPHSALEGPIKEVLRAHAEETKRIRYVPSLVRKKNSVSTTHELACVLFMRGCRLDLGAINMPKAKHQQPAVLSDLPTYRWRHDQQYWLESRLSRNFRLREFPRNDVLGLRTIESSDLEPTWRNVITLGSLPWLRDHRIESQVTCHMSYFICMAVEAAYQNATSWGFQVSSYILRNVRAGKALIMPETSEIETCISLKTASIRDISSSSDVWHDFMVCSWTKETGWLEHCRGCIAVRSANKIDGDVDKMMKRPNSSVQEVVSRIKVAASNQVDHDKMYKMAAEMGNEIGPASQGLFDCYSGPGLALGKIKFSDTEKIMPSHFQTDLIIHPVLLGSCFHLMFPIVNPDISSPNGVPIPLSVKELTLRHCAAKLPKLYLEAYGCGKRKLSSAGTVKSLLFIDPDTSEPILQLKDFTFDLLSGGKASKGNKKRDFFCSKLQWQHCLSLLKPEYVRNDFSVTSDTTTELDRIRLIEQASFYFLEEALSDISSKDCELLQDHQRKLYRWMQTKSTLINGKGVPLQNPEWTTLQPESRKEFLNSTQSLGVEGEMVCKMGRNLAKILRNEAEPLSLLLEDNLLTRYYRNTDTLNRSYEEAAALIDNLAHENPNMRIIEIGAGTGGATCPLLEALGFISEGTPRFRHYQFTDVSLSFFKKAKESLGPWESWLSSSRLDIEEDPLAQGYESEAYDLVIAANCLHATTRMIRTIGNVRKLLKPGGKLLLIEETVDSLRRFPFATLPGWWLGKLESFLHLNTNFY